MSDLCAISACSGFRMEKSAGYTGYAGYNNKTATENNCSVAVELIAPTQRLGATGVTRPPADARSVTPVTRKRVHGVTEAVTENVIAHQQPRARVTDVTPVTQKNIRRR